MSSDKHGGESGQGGHRSLWKKAVLLSLPVFITLCAAASIVPIIVFRDRVSSLARCLNDWPLQDLGALSLLGTGEDGLPSPDLLVLSGEEEESLYLVFPQESQLFISRLEPGLRLSDGQNRDLAGLRHEGLTSLLHQIRENTGIAPRRCVALDDSGLASLLSGAKRAGFCLSADQWLETLRSLGNENREDERAGLVYACFATLWRELFTSSAIWRHHGLQRELASVCRTMPTTEYKDLQRWGEELPIPLEASLVSMPLPRMDGESGEDSLLDIRAFRELMEKLPEGKDAVAAYLAEHRRRVEWERRVRRLGFDPIPPTILYGGNDQRMEVAITLDDGGNLDPRILDLLESYGIACTVFPIGRWAERNPEWIERMDRNGWEIANHTYTHPLYKPRRLVDMPDEEVREELLAAQEVITGITGKKYPYFRPPGGWVDERVVAIAGELGFLTIMWSIDSLDTINPHLSPPQRADRILADVRPGSILLFHFGGYGTYDTLSYLIPRMLERGFRFVTLRRLFTP